MYEAEKRARRYERLYGERILRPMLPHILGVLPPFTDEQVILDVECGSGIVSQELLPTISQSSVLIATEQDRAALRVFHHHPEIDNHPRCFVRQESPTHIGLAANVVDITIGHWRWQYITPQKDIISELVRIAKPQGKIVLTFLLPGCEGSLYDAFINIKAIHIADMLRHDGIASQVIYELLDRPEISHFDLHPIPVSLEIGQNSRPMMDRLLLDFLLPRWMGLANGEEITSADCAPFDLGNESLFWNFKVGIAVATIAQEKNEDVVREPDTTTETQESATLISAPHSNDLEFKIHDEKK